MIRRLFLINLLSIVLFPSAGLTGRAQNSQAQNRTQTGPATLGLEAGYLEFDTPDFKVLLRLPHKPACASNSRRNFRHWQLPPAPAIQKGAWSLHHPAQ